MSIASICSGVNIVRVELPDARDAAEQPARGRDRLVVRRDVDA
jgi:hypothetical protein